MQTQDLDQRLVSLDAFRGLTIAAMILVNNPGSWDHVYAPLLHAEWHGWTPTDLVYPFFLFIVGVAMVFSFAKQLPSKSKPEVYRRVLKRAVIIFLLGLFLNLLPNFDFATLRVAGVLQRIAIVYGVAALVALNTGVIGQAITAVGLLLGYWIALMWIPVPGHGAGVLTPESNLAAYIDGLLLPGRMWQGTWDPEGILSTIPAVSTTLFGVLAGHWLRSGKDRRVIAPAMLLVGLAMIVAGLVFDNWFPINKNLWTSSFVVFTAGAAQVGLTICYWLCDVQGYRKWFFPAIVFGANPITVYVLSGMLGDIISAWPIGSGDQGMSLQQWILANVFLPWTSSMNASLAYAICFLLFWFIIMSLFYRFRIFIKI